MPPLRSPMLWPRPSAGSRTSLPVDGDDVMALGVPSGPQVGAILAALEAWWVDHDFRPDRAACLAQAKRSGGEAAGSRRPRAGEGGRLDKRRLAYLCLGQAAWGIV